MSEKPHNRNASFKVLGIEFSGPVWLAVVFIIFCLVVIYAVSDTTKGKGEKVLESQTNNSEIKTEEDPCNVPWEQKPLSCK